MVVLVVRPLLVLPARRFGLVLKIPRMGSFTSAVKIQNDDTQDNDLALPEQLSRQELLQHCQKHLADLPPSIKRSFRRTNGPNFDWGLKYMKLNSISEACSDFVSSPYSLRVFQWNILSQSLGLYNDNFVCCPDEALDWKTRKYRIVEEIVEYCPDVICLQEVDHFHFLTQVLGTQGYVGMFFPKPDSPCLYINGNNGPDGCAIFFRQNKFDLLKKESRVLELWRVQSNQVAVLAILRIRETGQEICIATTHLKARTGALLSTLRNEQGKDLLHFINKHCEGRPLILCGDFNAEPSEPVYSTVLGHKALALSSAYADVDGDSELGTTAAREPAYTTWKIREEGEVCHTIDYVFYSKSALNVEAALQFPTGEELGEGKAPSFRYPSDHFSLVCDFRIGGNTSKTPARL